MTEQALFNTAWVIYEQCKKINENQHIKVHFTEKGNKCRITKISKIIFDYAIIDYGECILFFDRGDALETIITVIRNYLGKDY